VQRVALLKSTPTATGVCYSEVTPG
jgi:hypothetical protein